jgi:hypothetical protein
MRALPWLLPLLLVACGAPLPDAAPDALSDPPLDAATDHAEATDVAGRPDAAAGRPDAATDRPDAAADRPDVHDVVALPDVPPAEQRHSPLTPDLAARLRAIAARGASLADHVFSKVGDSITVSTSFMACFASTTGVDLGGREALRPTLDLYRGGAVGGTDPYRRVSLAATVGWSAWSALAGSPSPLTRELDAARPAAAAVMFGTNDIQSRDIFRYGANLLDLTDQLIARGTIPILSTVPPRDDSADADLWVPRYNAVARGVGGGGGGGGGGRGGPPPPPRPSCRSPRTASAPITCTPTRTPPARATAPAPSRPTACASGTTTATCSPLRRSTASPR